MFPDWFQPLTWKFNQKALCHACNSVRALPVDDQPVVDLPVSSSSTTVSNLLDSILQSHSVDLDCPRCCRQSHFVHDISVPDHPDKLLLHIRRSSGDIKSRAVVRIPSRIRHFDQHFRFVGAIVHIGDSPDSGHYITVLPPSTSSPGWTCLDDARVYTLATPCSRQWHLYRDATLLLFVLEPSVVPCGVPTLVGSDILSAPSFLDDVCQNECPIVCSHPPLQLITANITSWFSGWPQLLHDHVDSSGPCIYLVCETHLTHSGSRACLAGLHRLGLHGVFRCCPSSGMSSSSGVAVIASFPVREVPWTSPSLQKLATFRGRGNTW